jgi:hypothetical protein
VHLKVISAYVFPPIPVRDQDWIAYIDDLVEDSSSYGYGATEVEALRALAEELGSRILDVATGLEALNAHLRAAI